MDVQPAPRGQINDEIDRLAIEYRDMCLWFTPSGYLPKTDEERLATLADIERYRNREAFKRARELRDWLLRTSKGDSSSLHS